MAALGLVVTRRWWLGFRRPDRMLLPALGVWLLVVLGIAGGTAFYLRQQRAQIIEDAFSQAEAMARIAEQILLRTLEAARGTAELLALRHANLGFEYSSAAIALDDYLRALARDGRFGLNNFGLVGLDGQALWMAVRNGSGPLSRVAELESIAVWLNGRQEGPFIGRPVLGRATGRWGVQITDMLRNAAGEPVAITLVALDPLGLSASLGSMSDRPGRRLVVRRMLDGAIIARSGDAGSYLGHMARPDHNLLRAARAAEQGRLQYDSPLDGGRRMAAYRLVSHAPLLVAAVFDEPAELADFTVIAILAIGAAVLLALVALQLALAWVRARRMRDRLQQEATQDPLTGLPNRRGMEAAAARLLGAGAPGRHTHALLLFDLDHFKRVNDTYGHNAGDAVLRDVAGLLRRKLRPSDLVCRWGGEEILALLVDCSRSDALARSEELRLAIAGLYRGGDGPVPEITASVGVAVTDLPHQALAVLVQQADTALYVAKAEGRNRVVMASAGCMQELPEHETRPTGRIVP